MSAFFALYECCIVVKCLNEKCAFKEIFLGRMKKNFVRNDSPSRDHGQRCHRFLSLKGSSPKRGLKTHFSFTDKNDCIKNLHVHQWQRKKTQGKEAMLSRSTAVNCQLWTFPWCHPSFTNTSVNEIVTLLVILIGTWITLSLAHNFTNKRFCILFLALLQALTMPLQQRIHPSPVKRKHTNKMVHPQETTAPLICVLDWKVRPLSMW